MTKEEASRHEKLVLKGEALPENIYEPNVLAQVKTRHEEEKMYEKYR
jgi:tRNA threonylcarbamoyladenosine dehydratase